MNDYAEVALKKSTAKDITSLRSALSWLRAQGYLIETERKSIPILRSPACRSISTGVFRSCSTR